jgi:hypothetical protein
MPKNHWKNLLNVQINRSRNTLRCYLPKLELSQVRFLFGGHRKRGKRRRENEETSNLARALKGGALYFKAALGTGRRGGEKRERGEGEGEGRGERGGERRGERYCGIQVQHEFQFTNLLVTWLVSKNTRHPKN